MFLSIRAPVWGAIIFIPLKRHDILVSIRASV